MKAFSHTAVVEETLLLNDSFDTMNGRRFAERINPENWNEKKKPLVDLLKAIDISEEHSLASKGKEKPFLSDTSLKAMRITLQSTIELVNFLLEKGKYDFVLTGKFNQDCIEVYTFYTLL